MAKQKVELSEYERKRQENIAKTQALLRNLEMEAAEAGLAPTSRSGASARPKAKAKKPVPKKIKQEEVAPRRTSSRLKGIEADSETAKRKAEEEYDARREADRAKRQRVSDAFRFSDIVVAGQEWDHDGKFSSIVAPAKPYQRTFSADRVKGTTDKELRVLRERMMGLQLWETYGPSQIKLTPERIVGLFHSHQLVIIRVRTFNILVVLHGVPSNCRQAVSVRRRQIREPRNHRLLSKGLGSETRR